MGFPDFVSNANEGGIETKPGLHTHHHQVQRVWKFRFQLGLPGRGAIRQNAARRKKTNTAKNHRPKYNAESRRGLGQNELQQNKETG